MPPFRDHVFDGVMTAFVLRNVSDLRLFFVQAFRALKTRRADGFFGHVSAIERNIRFDSIRSISIASCLGLAAFSPGTGKHISIYRTLCASLCLQRKFPKLLEQCGFEQVTLQRFLFGAVCLHVGE